MSKTSEWREINGLRGVAVSLVMLHHFVISLPATNRAEAFIFQVLSAGWIGVEIFFVISGFLISKSLCETRGQRHYFKNFYARRALRILPLYFSLLAFYYAALLFFPRAISPNLAEPLKERWYLFWLNLSNLFSLTKFGLGSLAHLWSLAVEEQFYLVWPLVLYFTPPRRWVGVGASLLVASVLMRWVLLAAGLPTGMLYVFTPVRLDGFAIGAVIYFLLLETGEPTALRALGNRWLVFSSLLVLLFLFITQGVDARATGMPLLGYVVIAGLSGSWLLSLIKKRKKGFGATALNSRPAQLIGKYSYACYLFNYPLWFAMNKRGIGLWLKVTFGSHSMAYHVAYIGALFFSTVFLSFCAHYIIEKPALSLKRYFVGEPVYVVSIEKSIPLERPARGYR